MKSVLMYGGLSGLLFLLALLLLILGAAKKRNAFYIGAALSFVAFVGMGAFTSYLFVTKTKSALTEAFKPRTGAEIYEALLGKPLSCVKVLHHQDQIIPRIDVAIWLRFETCAEELERMLPLLPYNTDTIIVEGWLNPGLDASQEYYKPKTLGDTVVRYDYKKDEYGNGQTLFINLAQSEGILVDVLD